MSAVRQLSYDRATAGLVTNPLPAYASLRNGTLVTSAGVTVAPGRWLSPALPVGTGAAADIELVVGVPVSPAAAGSFELRVRQLRHHYDSSWLWNHFGFRSPRHPARAVLHACMHGVVCWYSVPMQPLASPPTTSRSPLTIRV